jgi:carboxyl-terminal processing protease
MSNLFLPRGKEILSYRGRGEMNEQFVAERDPMLPNTPLVVLVDDGSASASEIVAGALQDHDRALIVGTTSYGKGLVQSLFRLDGGYALKMTTAKWFTPSGRSIQRPRRIVNGRFVEEEAPDSMETDSARKARPAFRSGAGRVIYGGGGITPDITVRPDTLTTVEQKAARQLGPKVQEAYTLMSQYAEELRPQVKSPDFVVPAAWRQEYFRRLVAAKVPVDSATFFAGASYFDRFIATRVARAVYGDSTVAKRQFGEDPQLQKAIEVLRKGRTQRELFGMSSSPMPATPTAARRP